MLQIRFVVLLVPFNIVYWGVCCLYCFFFVLQHLLSLRVLCWATQGTRSYCLSYFVTYFVFLDVAIYLLLRVFCRATQGYRLPYSGVNVAICMVLQRYVVVSNFFFIVQGFEVILVLLKDVLLFRILCSAGCWGLSRGSLLVLWDV